MTDIQSQKVTDEPNENTIFMVWNFKDGMDVAPAFKRLCALVGTPLVSTSCNRSGRRALRHQREVQRCFGRDVYVVNGRCGGAKRPSRIVDAQSGAYLR